MTARQSAATDRAMRLVARGIPASEAARKAGIHPVTLWRAIKRLQPRSDPNDFSDERQRYDEALEDRKR